MSKIRVAVVGAGVMGRWHADSARRCGATIVAVVDPEFERAVRVAGSKALALATLEAAVDRGIDVVHICTPLQSHVALAMQALAAGCHVIVEKPVTPTHAEAVELAAAASAAGRLLVPVHQFGFQPGVRAILARQHTIGPLRHIEFATCSAGADLPGKSDRDLVAAEIAPHAFALARTFLPGPLGALDWHLDRGQPGEWKFSAVGPHRCTISGLISLSARPTFATFRVLGERGSATADLFHGFALFEPGTASRSYKIARPFAIGVGTLRAATPQLLSRAFRREAAYPGLRGLCAATYAAVLGRGEPPFRDGEVIDVAEGRDRLLALARHAAI